MLDHFEVIELEKKWQEFDKSRQKKSLLKDSFSSIRIDKFTFVLIAIIGVGLGSIFWLLYGGNSTIKESNLVATKIEQNTTNESKNETKDLKFESEKRVKKSDTREYLSLNDIGIKSSIDSGGFSFQDSNAKQNLSSQSESAVMSEEFIDFGNPPNPPSKNSAINRSSTAKKKPIIKIESTSIKQSNLTLEQRFEATRSIEYAIEIAQKSYDSNEYGKAIKWALIANDIDKNSIDSWVIFAKSNYKIGRKNDAITALKALSSRVKSENITALIAKMEDGTFK